MSASTLTPAQAAALRRARELAAELAGLAASVRAALREEASAAPAEPALEPGELRAAFSAARGAKGRRRPRELFGASRPVDSPA